MDRTASKPKTHRSLDSNSTDHKSAPRKTNGSGNDVPPADDPTVDFSARSVEVGQPGSPLRNVEVTTDLAVPRISTVVPEGLIRRESLVRHGSARGFQNQPAPNADELDSVEETLVSDCLHVLEEADSVHRDTIASYCDDVARLDQRKTTGPPELPQIKAKIQDTVRRFRDQLRQIALIAGHAPHHTLEEELRQVVTRYPHFASPGNDPRHSVMRRFSRRLAHRSTSKSNFKMWGMAILFIAIETALNGFFFAEQIVRPRQGFIEAILISMVNIIALAYLAARVVDLWMDAKDRRWWIGMLFSVIMIPTVAFHLGVAHYRDALSPNYPPSAPRPDMSIPDIAEELHVPEHVVECYTESAIASASQEALCLLRGNPIWFEGIKSWFFLALGMSLWWFALQHWRRRDDNSGTQLPRKIKAMTLRASHRVLTGTIRELDHLHGEALEVLRWSPGDFLARHEGIQTQATSLATLRENLETECRMGLDIYRNANREARGEEPAPDHWSRPWAPQWKIPQFQADDVPSRDNVLQVMESARDANRHRIVDMQNVVDGARRHVSDLYAQFSTVIDALPEFDRRWVIRLFEESDRKGNSQGEWREVT